MGRKRNHADDPEPNAQGERHQQDEEPARGTVVHRVDAEPEVKPPIGAHPSLYQTLDRLREQLADRIQRSMTVIEHEATRYPKGFTNLGLAIDDLVSRHQAVQADEADLALIDRVLAGEPVEKEHRIAPTRLSGVLASLSRFAARNDH